MSVCITFDTERDWHKILGAHSKAPYENREFKMIEKAIPRLIEIADEYKISHTFFLCGEVAESCSSLFKSLTEHCFAVHTHPFTHESLFRGTNPNDEEGDRLSTYSRQEQLQMISRDLELIQDHLGFKPRIFRAGKHSVNNDTFTVLEQLGIKIDCSMHLGYQFIGWRPFRILGTSLWEIPTYCDISPEAIFQAEILFKLSSVVKDLFSGVYVVIIHPMVFGNPLIDSQVLLQKYEQWIEKLVEWNFDFLTIPQALKKRGIVRKRCNEIGKCVTSFLRPVSLFNKKVWMST